AGLLSAFQVDSFFLYFNLISFLKMDVPPTDPNNFQTAIRTASNMTPSAPAPFPHNHCIFSSFTEAEGHIIGNVEQSPTDIKWPGEDNPKSSFRMPHRPSR